VTERFGHLAFCDSYYILTERFGHSTPWSNRLNQEIDPMLTKTAFGLALILATASVSMAATKRPHAIAPVNTQQNLNNPAGAYVATDPDANVRLNLRRDWSHGL
jgi:hypothetical protein